ncbi:MAG: LYR motif-containing protein [Pedobacter sp.]|nr:MAG: LYR motif-containing protein [Pedobacter sp.]
MSIISHRQEVIKLYRDIVRATRLFSWPNEQGVLWSEILRRNARQEFEEARFEKDPTLIIRMLVVGRDCLNQTVESLIKKSKGFQK